MITKYKENFEEIFSHSPENIGENLQKLLSEEPVLGNRLLPERKSDVFFLGCLTTLSGARVHRVEQMDDR
jgi:hypothetical protein